MALQLSAEPMARNRRIPPSATAPAHAKIGVQSTLSPQHVIYKYVHISVYMCGIPPPPPGSTHCLFFVLLSGMELSHQQDNSAPEHLGPQGFRACDLAIHNA